MLLRKRHFWFVIVSKGPLNLQTLFMKSINPSKIFCRIISAWSSNSLFRCKLFFGRAFKLHPDPYHRRLLHCCYHCCCSQLAVVAEAGSEAGDSYGSPDRGCDFQDLWNRFTKISQCHIYAWLRSPNRHSMDRKTYLSDNTITIN